MCDQDDLLYGRDIFLFACRNQRKRSPFACRNQRKMKHACRKRLRQTKDDMVMESTPSLSVLRRRVASVRFPRSHSEGVSTPIFNFRALHLMIVWIRVIRQTFRLRHIPEKCSLRIISLKQPRTGLLLGTVDVIRVITEPVIYRVDSSLIHGLVNNTKCQWLSTFVLFTD